MEYIRSKFISSKCKYLFDLNGYIIVRGILNPKELNSANMAIDKRIDNLAKERKNNILRNTKEGTPLAGNGTTGRKDLGGILEWTDTDVFKSILDHPKLIPYFHEFCGEGYRMDHSPFIIIQDEGAEGFALHGGSIDVLSGEYNPHLAYSCIHGKIYNPLLAVSVVLSDHDRGDGGFVVVKGSHKSNFPAPISIINGELSKEELQDEEDLLHQPVTKAGDIILFSEGTVHGARPWTNKDRQRRVALYRFSPPSVGYGRSYWPSWPEKILANLTNSQKAVLEPPYALRLDRPVLDLNSNLNENETINQDQVNIKIVSRQKEKKDFDKEVFGTDYF